MKTFEPMRKTKIICTVGPSTKTVERMKELIEAGINLARFNMSHGNYEEHSELIRTVRTAASDLKKPIGLILDTKGPEIRTLPIDTEYIEPNVENPNPIDRYIELKKGQKFTFVVEDSIKTSATIGKTTYSDLPNIMRPGQRIRIDDGIIELKVVEVVNQEVRCEVLDGGRLYTNKGINLPDTKVNFSTPTTKDVEDIHFAIEQGLDFIAASFICCAQDVLDIRKILTDNGAGQIKILAKIENREGKDNFEEILEVADGIMIARGDLGVELEPEEVPTIQKDFIKRCNEVGKPVVTATHMLESMTTSPRPTRAEANDVANAIFDGTDAIMLSGETARGMHPRRVVQMMSDIAIYAEKTMTYHRALGESDKINVPDAISYAASAISSNIGAGNILTATRSGYTAIHVAKYRPKSLIIAIASNETVYRQLSLTWGVLPLLLNEIQNITEHKDFFEMAENEVKKLGLVKKGDTIVMVAGFPFGQEGSTNNIYVQVVGREM